jgi:hypothetical protein
VQRLAPFCPRLALLLALACVVWPAAGRAQSPGASATVVPGVTVQGRKPQAAPSIPTPQQRAFVESHAAPSRIGQMTRWSQPVCPTTFGLSAEMNAFVSQRVKDVAAEVGAPSGTCQSDVVIVFTSQPQALLDSVRRRAPVLLGFHYPAQAKRIATVAHPIQAWYVTATASDAGGHGLGGAGTGLLQGALSAVGGPGRGGVLDDGCCGAPGGCAGSHFTVCLSSEFVAAVVVVNRDEVAGMSIGSVADYVSMLVLSRVDLNQGCSQPDSITNLLAAACPQAARPTALTDTDLAYLKALYAIDMARLMWVQRGSVADLMAAALNGAQRGPAASSK